MADDTSIDDEITALKKKLGAQTPPAQSAPIQQGAPTDDIDAEIKQLQQKVIGQVQTAPERSLSDKLIGGVNATLEGADRGLAHLGGIFGDVHDLEAAGVDKMNQWIASKFGIPYEPGTVQKGLKEFELLPVPTSADINNLRAKYLGGYTPQTGVESGLTNMTDAATQAMLMGAPAALRSAGSAAIPLIKQGVAGAATVPGADAAAELNRRVAGNASGQGDGYLPEWAARLLGGLGAGVGVGNLENAAEGSVREAPNTQVFSDTGVKPIVPGNFTGEDPGWITSKLNSIFGYGNAAAKMQTGQIQSYAQDILENKLGGATAPEEAGQGILNAADRITKNFYDTTASKFDAARTQIDPTTPIDTKPVLDLFSAPSTIPEADISAGAVPKVYNDFKAKFMPTTPGVNGEPVALPPRESMSFAGMDQIRKEVGDALTSGTLSGADRTYLGNLYGKIVDATGSSLEGQNPAGAKLWDDARSFYSQGKDYLDNTVSKITNKNAGQAFDYVAGKYGGTNLNQLDTAPAEMGPFLTPEERQSIASAVVTRNSGVNTGEFDIDKFRKTYNNLSDTNKDALFSDPEIRQALDNLSEVTGLTANGRTAFSGEKQGVLPHAIDLGLGALIGEGGGHFFGDPINALTGATAAGTGLLAGKLSVNPTLAGLRAAGGNQPFLRPLAPTVASQAFAPIPLGAGPRTTPLQTSQDETQTTPATPQDFASWAGAAHPADVITYVANTAGTAPAMALQNAATNGEDAYNAALYNLMTKPSFRTAMADQNG